MDTKAIMATGGPGNSPLPPGSSIAPGGSIAGGYGAPGGYGAGFNTGYGAPYGGYGAGYGPAMGGYPGYPDPYAMMYQQYPPHMTMATDGGAVDTNSAAAGAGVTTEGAVPPGGAANTQGGDASSAGHGGLAVDREIYYEQFWQYYTAYGEELGEGNRISWICNCFFFDNVIFHTRVWSEEEMGSRRGVKKMQS